MTRRAILVAASCAALLTGSSLTHAAPFGELYSPRQARTFASPILDPVIAKWLMTLPQDAALPQPATADPALAEEAVAKDGPGKDGLAKDGLAKDGLAGEMLAGTPIGGEAQKLIPPEPAERTASGHPPAAEGALTAQMLDAAPIGGNVYRLTTRADGEVTASISKPAPAKPEALASDDAMSNLANPESGLAVWYRLPGRTASGEVANPQALTAGHRTLPFGSRVRVVNRVNGASVIVRINDRGPRQKKFVIDLSEASAKAIGLTGTAPVTLNVEQWGAIAANGARTPALEGRSAVKRGAHARKRAGKSHVKARHGG